MLLISAALITAEPSASAIHNCTPAGQQWGNYFDGYTHWGGAALGVSAVLVTRSAAQCGTDLSLNNATTGWTMLADSTNHGYMQSGYLKMRSVGFFQHFSQIYNSAFNGGVPATYVIPGVTVGSGETHRYWQQYSPDQWGEFHSNVDVTVIADTSPGMLTYGWTGFNQHFYGETTYLSNDIPGSSGSPLTFSQVSFQNLLAPHNYVQYPCGSMSIINSQPSRWSIAPIGCTLGPSFKVWT